MTEGRGRNVFALTEGQPWPPLVVSNRAAHGMGSAGFL